MTKYFYRGPMPWEMDGGAVVNYYLLKKMNFIRPRDEYYSLPKVPQELDASYLPWVNYANSNNPIRDIPSIMSSEQIPILNLFHVGRDEINQLIDPVHMIGGKIVLHQTIHWPDDDIMKLERLQDIDKIVAPTMYAKSVFQTVGKLQPEQIEVLPHGIDTSVYYPHSTILEQQMGIDRSKQKVILYSGRLSAWKGVKEVIPIMRKLIQEYNCVFIIRGGAFEGLDDSAKFAYIFDRMSRNNPNIFFVPEWKPPEYMEELYAMVDILLFNSGHEGFGCPLIEIQAVGGVPVTTALANHVEICGRSGHVGILLDPKIKVGEVNNGTNIRVASSDQLYGATKWLLENPDEMEFMGIRGLRNVRERFELSDIAQAWFNLYDNLVPEGYSMDDAMRENIGLE